MKILFLSARYPPDDRGGGEISTHLIAQGLQHLGHDISVVTSAPRGEHIEVDGVAVRRLALPLSAKPLLERRHTRRMAHLLTKELGDLSAYDVVHAHDFRTAQLLYELQLPQMVATLRDYASICGTTNAVLRNGDRCTCSWLDIARTQRFHEASWARKPFRFWQYAYNIAYRRESLGSLPRVIFISEAQRQEISRQLDISAHATQVIYNPVGNAYFSELVDEPAGSDLLYVGTIEDYKGVRLLLEAWRDLAATYKHVKLRLVGDGAQRRTYERLVQSWRLDHQIIFVGRVPWGSLQKHIDAARVVVAPHVWIEPFGRTVVEAMARGKVVVTARSGGPGEYVADDETGLLFTPGSVEALRRSLQLAVELAPKRYDAIGASARLWTQKHLSTSIIAEQYAAFYQLNR